MNRTDITNAFFETIRDSLEWATVAEDKKYGSYVDGAVAMTEKMIDMHCNEPYTNADTSDTDGKIAAYVSAMNCLADK